MSKLLFLFERDMPTVSITREVFSNLHGQDQIKSSFMYLEDVKPSNIDDNDVVIFMRPNNIYAWKIADEARKAGHVTVTFCDDDLLNAILNHYADRAASKQTRTDFRINVPQMSKEQTFDFASVLTNLLENAQQGCDTVEPIDRSIGLRLDVVNDDNLFMVVSNSFDGNVRKVGGRYLSTRRKRGDRGTGLRSIERTVARYDGEVEFYHKGRSFYVDLTMKVEKDSEES